MKPIIIFSGEIASYECDLGEEVIEITGMITSHNDGRREFFGFEADWFSSDMAHAYFDNDWENITDDIIEAYENQLKAK